ncbi:hypothetical protein ANCDUO_01375 [Ancylostoma duodenale]|uniref:Secreted protein n=1 Tax=Ancylostoma duodenale TaxID=51022 RepID=A0A0C2HFC4_9BILA|nr:hypothetical protein ANCDUO_01375 [Ancylostoma duodenale]
MRSLLFFLFAAIGEGVQRKDLRAPRSFVLLAYKQNVWKSKRSATQSRRRAVHKIRPISEPNAGISAPVRVDL